MKTYLACMGTRPEIIKMAVLCRLLREQGHTVLILHTGQHEEMAHVLYRLFQMPPNIEIDLQRRSQRLGDLTGQLLERIDSVVGQVRPDMVLVQGDTSSALAGAMAGYYHDSPVGHVEAGLRTGEREPFPEEKNRELIARLAHWHFPPTAQAEANLLREGVNADRVFQVGNTVIDAALWVRDRLAKGCGGEEAQLPEDLCDCMRQNDGRRMMLVTAHRRENWGPPIRDIAVAVARLLVEHPDLVAVWPVHPNPSVQSDVAQGLAALPPAAKSRLCLTGPLDYTALIWALGRCHFTLTDSGGIQEEASALAKPVLIARNSTERQELLQAGGARLEHVGGLGAVAAA